MRSFGLQSGRPRFEVLLFLRRVMAVSATLRAVSAACCVAT